MPSSNTTVALPLPTRDPNSPSGWRNGIMVQRQWGYVMDFTPRMTARRRVLPADPPDFRDPGDWDFRAGEVDLMRVNRD